VPSVSVIKGLRTDPEKEDALQGWRDRFDGQSSWSRPWWNDQKQFKAVRGTVHFTILNALGDASGETYFHEVGDSDWGMEEYYSEYVLKNLQVRTLTRYRSPHETTSTTGNTHGIRLCVV